MRAALAAGLLLAAPGCAFEAGEPYGLLEATLETGYLVDADRDLGEGWQRLASDYALAVDEATIWVEAVELRAAQAIGPASFDPANPPAGYGSCHSGHCHSADGRLVSYEEIAAELGGAAEGGSTLRLAGGRFEVLAGERRTLPCPDDCLLDRGLISGVSLRISSLRLLGRVRDQRTPPRLAAEQPVVADLAFDGSPYPAVAVDLPLDLPIDDDHPSRIQLDLRLAVAARLFDDVAFDLVPADALQRLDLGVDETAADALVARLGEAQLEASATRSDP